ncbi:glutamate synthase-related protein [Aquimarina hainanensis]|uniref:Glutamate synthase-related protein n=1 Tax=Aquimarina hainanensis TaxID=1578017 RepID=A0ABW5NCN6_9FLAO
MNKPRIADKKPIKITLVKGEEQYWCACGLSNNQPYCDGSHRTTDFIPKKFVAKETGDAYLCMCKHSENAPYCDGTHAKLKEDNNSTSVSATTVGSTKEEPTLAYIKALAKDGLSKTGHHGEMGAMGVPIPELPKWNDIQILAAQIATKPLMEEVPVKSELILGPNAKKPLKLAIPLFVSDMSFGALSEEAKISLAKGAELAGTGICSGEGGMLDEEQAANSKYFYEYASAKFGFEWEKLKRVQAFHFKGGQGAKTGTGGHLSGNKVIGKIAQVRNLEEGTPAVSPPTFDDLHTAEDYKNFADKVREVTGGIPIGFKLSANHIEEDIQFALDASADYIILDGRGGGTGAAPLIFRNNISVPTIPALARARYYLDTVNRGDVTLIITGGIRVPDDFIKAMALGADGIALSNAALQSIGCVAARICNTNNCPAGVATQKPELRKLLNIDTSAKQLFNFFSASTELMKVMARACGHDHLNQFNQKDITTWKKDMAELTGIRFAGMK